jgi:hypothetical protein
MLLRSDAFECVGETPAASRGRSARKPELLEKEDAASADRCATNRPSFKEYYLFK